MMIRGILFDFDGTLSNRKLAANHMYRQCILKMRSDLSADDLETETMVQFCMIADQYGIIPKRYVWQRLKDNYIPELDVEEWNDYWYQNFNKIQIPNNGAEEALKILKKHYKLGILTNGDYETQLAKVKMTGFDQLVDEVIVCGQYGISKPDERIFRIAAEKLGLSCEETAMVGDMFFTDICGAIKAGMKPVWYIGDENFISDYDVTAVRSFREILELFHGEECE